MFAVGATSQDTSGLDARSLFMADARCLAMKLLSVTLAAKNVRRTTPQPTARTGKRLPAGAGKHAALGGD